MRTDTNDHINISFVIPCFNASRTLSKCVQSILDQRKEGLKHEIIVVDNNSQDDSLEVLKAYSQDIIITTEKKQGRSWARNHGLSLARGEVVAFIDADVYLDEDWSIVLYKLFIDDTNVIASQGQIKPCREFGLKSLNDYRYKDVKVSTGNSFILTTLIRYEWPMINSAACMYRRDFATSVGGFDTNLERHEDIDLSRRAFFSGKKISCSSLATAHVIFHGETWFDYMKRSFADGYYKICYLDKWRGIEPPLIGPYRISNKDKMDFNLKCQKMLIHMFNILGKVCGKIVYRKKPWILPPKLSKGSVIVDGETLS